MLVVEAALKTGSLITVRLAADFGCDVFAIPGSIHSPVSRGCHALTIQGAVLVESAQEVLSQYPPLTAIGHAPVLPDVPADHLGLPPGEVSAHPVMLELAGRLERRSDGRVVRAAPAG